MKEIVFFNHFHNGDIHVSREIVNKIINHVNITFPGQYSFSYGHCNPSNLLNDINDLKYDSSALQVIKDPHLNLINVNNKTYINTWYAQQNYKYMNPYGMTMDCLYSALNDSCQTLWGFSLSDISNDLSEFFPKIDYDKFEINAAKNWLSNHPEKKIFVANGQAMSGQAVNFPMLPIIIKLAQKHSNKAFILSNNEGNANLPFNVFYSSGIIAKNGLSDLNENSYLSSHCDVIVGRSSGASTFAMTQNNLFKRNIKILYFTNIVPIPPNKFWSDSIFRDKVNFSAEIINTNEHDPGQVWNLIDSKL